MNKPITIYTDGSSIGNHGPGGYVIGMMVEGEDYKNFVNSEFTNTRKSILAAYDQLLTSKYKIQLNQKTIDRVKNYFK